MEMTGENVAAFNLGALAGRVATIQSTVFPLIAADFHKLEDKRWNDNGPGWAPLTDTTVAIKGRRNMPFPQKILYGEGALLHSLDGFTEHTVYDVKPDEMVVGTNVPYARFHQSGPRAIRVFGKGAATLPERKLVDLTPADAARWAAMIFAVIRTLA